MADSSSPLRPSPQQRRLLELGAPGGPFRAECELSISGPLDPARLEQALGRVVARHDNLRLARAANGGESLVIARGAPPALVRHRDEPSFAAARGADFPPGAPLLHAGLLRLAPDRHRLGLELSALAADARTLELLVAELFRTYAGEAPQAEPPSWSEVAALLDDLLESEEHAAGRRFWNRGAAPPPPRLPFDRETAPDARFAPRSVERPLPDDLVSRLGEPRPFLLAAWAALLARLGGSDRPIGVAVALDGRRFEELAQVAGPLARHVPIPCAARPTTRFADLVREVSTALALGERWQEFVAPGEPLPYAFAFAELPPPARFGDLEVTLLGRDALLERFRLELVCERRGASLSTRLRHDPARIAEEDARRLLPELHALVACAAVEPGRPVGRLDLLGEDERRRLVTELNRTEASYPRGLSIHELIAEVARAHPERVAVETPDSRLTYRELEARANRLARRLRADGVATGDLVAIAVERSLEMVTGLLGILKAGAAYVPIDPAYPRERIAYLLEDSGARTLLTQGRLLGALPPLEARTVCLDRPEPEEGGDDPGPPPTGVSPGHLVYVIYTSGTTGRPKGVMVSHEGLVMSNAARRSAFREKVGKFLLLSPLAFDSSVVGLFWTLLDGGTLLLVPREEQQEPARLAARIEERGVTHLLTLPSLWQVILEHAPPERLASLRTAIVAGEACPLKLVRRHLERLPATELWSEYGATETTVWASLYDCRKQTIPVAPLGSPIDNATMYVLDQRLEPCPVGVPGEVHFGGRALALGYWRRPDLTAERFPPDPFSPRPGSRLYRSGDLARHLPGGDIEFLGRIDNQIKIRGFRVELEEIEAVLGGHPVLREAAVAALPAGEGAPASKRLVAYLVPQGPAAPDLRELRAWLEARLPDYMVPSTFVTLPALPRTPNGKVDRAALPQPEASLPSTVAAAVAPPRTATERLLADIWGRLLGVAEVGIHDNFFELGGDSILSIQAVARASQAGLRIRPRDLFENQTVAGLAAVADRAAPAAKAAPAAQAPESGPVPLTPIQLWLLERDPPDPSHANMSLLLAPTAPLDAALLERALAALLERHDALRLRVARDASGFKQWIEPPGAASFPLERADLAALPGSDPALRLEARAAVAQASLDLGRGPLARAVLFELGAERGQRLLLVLHHMACDGVSWRILLEDLETALAQLGRGEVVSLPPRTTSFRRWAELLRARARSEEVLGEASHWLSLPSDPSPLPVDLAAGAEENTFATADTVSLSLDGDETRLLLQELPRARGATVDEALLAALASALQRFTGHAAQPIDLEGHGREPWTDDVDLTRTVGWFTTTWPVVLELPAAPSPAEALAAVRTELRRVPGRGLGYGLLRWLRPDQAVARSLEAIPPAEVSYNYLGRFDDVLGRAFRLAPEPAGPDFCPRARRPHVLEVVALVADGRLRLDLVFSCALHRRATIAHLGEDLLATLRALLADASRGEAAVSAADMAEFGWNERDVAEITKAIRRAGG